MICLNHSNGHYLCSWCFLKMQCNHRSLKRELNFNRNFKYKTFNNFQMPGRKTYNSWERAMKLSLKSKKFSKKSPESFLFPYFQFLIFFGAQFGFYDRNSERNGCHCNFRKIKSTSTKIQTRKL